MEREPRRRAYLKGALSPLSGLKQGVVSMRVCTRPHVRARVLGWSSSGRTRCVIYAEPAPSCAASALAAPQAQWVHTGHHFSWRERLRGGGGPSRRTLRASGCGVRPSGRPSVMWIIHTPSARGFCRNVQKAALCVAWRMGTGHWPCPGRLTVTVTSALAPAQPLVFEQTPGDGEGQRSLACCIQPMRSHRVGHDLETERQQQHLGLS